VIDALRREVAHQGLIDAVQVTTCGSLGLCEHGPNVVVYPEGIWYSGVRPEDVPEIVGSHFRNDTVVERLARTDPSTLRAEILLNRSKMQASMRRKDEAGSLPDELLGTIRAFQESRVILTAIELDVFTAVGSGATSLEVAATVGTDPRATEMLLNVLVALGLLAKEGTRFSNTSTAARYLAAGGKNDARAGLMHTVNLWSRWSTLTECVRAGTSVRRVEEPQDVAWTRAFIAAMENNAAERAPAVVQAVGASGIARMLDVGGGSAAYSRSFARANGSLQADVLDLPTVAPLTRDYIDRDGLSDRVRVRPGDLTSGPLGEGYDLVLVSAICHMLDTAANRDLIRRCHSALAPGGRIVIQDFILNADRTGPKIGALFALNMLVGTEAGSSYSEEDYAGWLKEAGFGNVRHVRLPGPAGLMIGHRPE
jgi:(2Fe-2S) ferredoxin/SAM-dependent methyltransferase